MFPGIMKNRTRWYQVELTDRQVRDGAALFELQHTAWEVFKKLNEPEQMAVFAGRFFANDKLPIYFSPGAVAECKMLLRQFSAAPCKKPNGNLRLIVGHDDTALLD